MVTLSPRRIVPSMAIALAFSTASISALAQQSPPTTPPTTTAPPVLDQTPLPTPPTVLAPMRVPRAQMRRRVSTLLDDERAGQRTPPSGDRTTSATASSNTGEDPVVERRGVRVVLANLATAGVGLAAGAAATFGFFLSAVGGGITLAVFTGTAALAVDLFALPAVYTATSAALGGNGSYWSAFAGNGISTGIAALLLFPVSSSRSSEAVIAYSVLAPIAVFASMSIAYEVSTRERPQPNTVRRREEARVQLFPSVFANQTQQGLSLMGTF